MIDAELLEELRQDMIQESWEDEQHEYKMRRDDDYFGDELANMFEDTIRQVEVDLENYCSQYDRGDQANGWFETLVEK